ncbi:MAG: TatD family hydrolase [Rickettsiaceae bacterium]|nr:TatD family hydrolase [Rickettsiaceae bacterium]
MIIDSHCHLNMKEFESDLDQVIQNALNNGVQYMQTICTKFKDLEEILAIAEKYSNVFASVGVHPHHADEAESYLNKDSLIDLIMKNKKVIGIGETGLDYYYEHSNKENQKKAFTDHINASQETGLPLIIHTRDADKDTIDILESEMKNASFPALVHCFTSSKELAFKALDFGFYISVSGIITFKNASELCSTISQIPLDRLLIETDAPYLSPVPVRGKRCEPAFVKFVGEKLAEIKNTSSSEVFSTTTNNFFKLFTRAHEIISL